MSREMKDSGVEWIGEIPKNWDVMKLLFVLRRSITDGPHETPNLVESQEGIPFISVDSLNNTKQVDLSIVKKYISVKDYKEYRKKAFLEKGDVLFTKAATIGKTAIVDNPTEYMIWSPIAILKPNEKCFNEYLYYILNCKEAIKYTRDIIGHETTQVNVGMRDLEKLKIPIAPFDEQKRIAIFLDSKCEAIDQAIQKQKDIVNKLIEYKQSVITQAVSKGLNLNVEMKNSGIPWIGETPEKWEIMRIKDTSWLKGRIGWDGLKASEFIDEGPYLITGTDFCNGYVNWDTCVHITKQRFEEDTLLHIRENDLLITKDGTVGKVAIAKNCPKETSLNSGVMIIRNESRYIYNSKYMYYILLSDEFKHWFEYSQKPGSTIKHLYQHQFRDFKYTFPPLEEQQQIADFLDSKCSKINESIERSNKIIQKLEEYKKALIYNAVTGKIDCRNA